MMQSQDHWNAVYRTKDARRVSWYQPHAQLSLDLIRALEADHAAPIIDIGAGASTLVDDLLDSGYGDVSVLDIAAEGLHLARERLGARAAAVQWFTADITQVALPAQHYAVWHDRAVFHFLTDAVSRQAYVRQVLRAVRPGGLVIIATFATDGPLQCSGLPVVRYSPEGLHHAFGAAFELLDHREETHITPSGAVQPFVYCYCKRLPN
jgi:SAM-dependent methyltransferase